MSGTTYGITFSKKLCDQGKYQEALAEAEKAMAFDPEDPQPVYDRAAAEYCLGSYADATRDFARAIQLESVANLMDEGVLDDDLFECLRKWAESEPTRARSILARYAELMPEGSHQLDVGKWIVHIETDPKNRAS
jgi:tetratricopeptide (TPR) repeat protein